MVLDKDGRLEVKIIDFGLCERIIKDGQHVHERTDQGVKGTYCYMSRAAHSRRSMSRRDDWESLCYVIYALIIGQLPWLWVKDKSKMHQMKEEFVKNKGWNNTATPEIFTEYNDIIFSLGFEQEPNPVTLVSILMQMNSSYYSFEWNKFIWDKQTHQLACKQFREIEDAEYLLHPEMQLVAHQPFK